MVTTDDNVDADAPNSATSTEHHSGKVHRYSVSLVTQGKHRFYTLTMPSNVLAKTCFVSTRDEDPQHGFQRLLDKRRAQEIADYVDTGLGTIPTSVVLSAQADAQLKVIGKGKTLEFVASPKAFLVLDGQHRIYGFSLARTAMRVPVVVYNNLTRTDETRLFIDINTKQRPVPNELLLDIKSLAEYENDQEQVLRQIFDFFSSDSSSPLLGLLSPAQRSPGKLTRVTFNAAIKPLLPRFSDPQPLEIYNALRPYIAAFWYGCQQRNMAASITHPLVFRAAVHLFTEVAQRVNDRHGRKYTEENFQEILEPMFRKVRRPVFQTPGNSYKKLRDELSTALKQSFTI